MAKTLVNFLVNPQDLARFDAVANILGRTRTSILTDLMRNFCLDQAAEIKTRNQKLVELSEALDRQHVLSKQHRYSIQAQEHDMEDSDELPMALLQEDHWELF